MINRRKNSKRSRGKALISLTEEIPFEIQYTQMAQSAMFCGDYVRDALSLFLLNRELFV